eukprot:833802-Rhodomonas_salina.2
MAGRSKERRTKNCLSASDQTVTLFGCPDCTSSKQPSHCQLTSSALRSKHLPASLAPNVLFLSHEEDKNITAVGGSQWCGAAPTTTDRRMVKSRPATRHTLRTSLSLSFFTCLYIEPMCSLFKACAATASCARSVSEEQTPELPPPHRSMLLSEVLRLAGPRVRRTGCNMKYDRCPGWSRSMMKRRKPWKRYLVRLRVRGHTGGKP